MAVKAVPSSVRLSHRSTRATVAGWFAAECPADRIYRSAAAGAILQALALSSKLSSVMLTANEGGRLNTDLFLSVSQHIPNVSTRIDQ